MISRLILPPREPCKLSYTIVNTVYIHICTFNFSPSARTLLSFCQQVANGMKFLSDRKFVHRHLMAQNIFLAENGVCKVCKIACTSTELSINIRSLLTQIGSFGTSLLLETEDLRISHGISIPTRWAAPEVKMESHSHAGVRLPACGSIPYR